jgi:benzoate/toluate 1,2-dioxygenase alpha subunit
MGVKPARFYVDDRPEDGVFRVHRDVYADPELFELEIKYIFERTWNFLTLESQIAKPNDYITTFIGRTPVIVARDAKGRIGAFLNACRHKGATICRFEKGNAKFHVCLYHGWAYDSAGKNVSIKQREVADYPAAFDAESHDLIPIGKLDTYKGLIFGSLSPDVPPLLDHLGDLKFFIDLHMEQGPQGMEIIPGRVAYTYRGNWKMQLENGQDPYHVDTAHGSFMAIAERRRKGQGNVAARELDWQKRNNVQIGAYEFPFGHTSVWHEVAEPERRAVYPALDEIRSRVGALKADWMIKQRNAVFFPNLQIADQIVPILRTFRPITPDLTELRSNVIGPIGEPVEQRAARLRQFEDFVNPGGYATPDDVTVFADCQVGFKSTGVDYLQGYSRGIAVMERGANDEAREAGLHPLTSVKGHRTQNTEIGTHAPFREWVRLMEAGMAGKKAYS